MIRRIAFDPKVFAAVPANENRLLATAAPRRIAVLRALQLGDMLCAVPALRALRASAPRATVTLVGLAWARDLVERLPYVDDFLELPGWPGLPETEPRIDEIPRFLATAQSLDFDLALQLHGSGAITNPLSVLLGARRTGGSYRIGEWIPDRELFVEYPDDVHEVERLLRVVEALGGERAGEELEFPVTDADRAELASVLDLGGEPYACVHPGGRQPGALWPAERFAAVADGLAERGLRVVLSGTASERELVERVARTMATDPTVAAGRTTLGSLAALLERAELLVANDTGVAHLAAALGRPAVLVFRESQLARWGPRGLEPHHAVRRDAGPDAVLREADALLAAPAAR